MRWKALLCCCVLIPAAAAKKGVTAIPSPDWPEFTARVNDYVKIHRDAAKNLPKLIPKSTPEQIQAHEKALGQAIMNARPNAKPGELFVPEVQPKFQQVIASETRGKEGKSALDAIMSDNPKGAVALRVNTVYAEKAPLSTVPPTLLLRLPKLPEEVEYRFVDGSLILHDVAANLIVDYMKAGLAAPKPAVRRAKRK